MKPQICQMRIALISDIHEDLASLKKFLHAIEKQQVDRIYCLGDIAGYNSTYNDFENKRNASACLELLKKEASLILLGNHDLNAAKITPSFTSGFQYPENWFELSTEEQQKMAKDKIWIYGTEELEANFTKEDIAFLAKLPEYDIQEIKKQKILFSHYFYPNINGSAKAFFSKTKELIPHFEWMHKNHCNISFSGHGHTENTLIYQLGKTTHLPYNQEFKLDTMSAVLIPPLLRNNICQGFCIFDSETFSLKAYKIYV